MKWNTTCIRDQGRRGTCVAFGISAALACNNYAGEACSDTNHQAEVVCRQVNTTVVKEVVSEVCTWVEDSVDEIPIIGGFISDVVGEYVCEPVTELVETVPKKCRVVQCFLLHSRAITLCFMSMNFAIIGDVHGMLEPLERLLTIFGFTYEQGVYQHKNYKAVFLGDLVDRGKHQRGVLELVRKMVDEGHAYAVMGNHEHNAVGYYWRHPKTNKYLVPHKTFRNEMHAAVLNDYPLRGDDAQEIMAWMSQLPVYLELDGFRAVHACWHDASIDAIQPFLNEQNRFHPEAFIESFDKTTPVYQPLSRLIRGATIKLPRESGIVDDFGNTHKNVRVQWWRNNYQSWDELLTRQSDVRQARGMPLPEGYLDDNHYPEGNPPVFFGHYWFSGVPEHLRSNIACMDYSACVGGKLVAYDWRAEEKPALTGLRQDRFVSVDSHSFLDD